MLNNASGFRKVYVAAGYTDLRRGIDGLASIVKFNFRLDPYEKDILFLFCGRRSDRIKGVFCKHFLEKNAKYFWRMLHLQIGESCKASAGSYSASYIAIADHI